MNKISKISKCLLLFLLSLSVISCNPTHVSDTSISSPTKVINISNGESIDIEIGENYQLNVELENITGVVLYSSENANIASVDQNGVVSAKEVGTTIITASAENIYDEIIINVIKKPIVIEKFVLEIKDSSLAIGEKRRLKVNIGNNKYLKEATFEIIQGNDKISINDSVITALKVGTAKVIAKYEEYVSNELTIDIVNFKVIPGSNLLQIKKYTKMRFISFPTGGNTGCSFEIDDPSIVLIEYDPHGSNNIYVTGLKEGTTKFRIIKDDEISNFVEIKVVSGNPYKDMSKEEFYKNYQRSSSYQDTRYRDEYNLMSGDITPQDQKPSLADNIPTKDGLNIHNNYSVFTNQSNTYTVVDEFGNPSFEVHRFGAYETLEEVAAFIYAFGFPPINYHANKNNYPSPSESEWGEHLRLNDSEFTNKSANKYEPALPRNASNGGDLIYYEVDIGTTGTDCDPSYQSAIYNDGKTITRGAARIVYSKYYKNNQLPIDNLEDRYVFYTYNHYNDFQEYLNYEGGWGTMFGNITGGGTISTYNPAYPPTPYVNSIRARLA